MNTQRNSMKTWLWIGGVAVVLIGAYFYFSGSSSTQNSSTLQVAAMPDAAVGAQVLNLLKQISTLQIDTTLFKDPSYQTLQDFSVTIPPQNVGRVNPFAPIPGLSTTPKSGVNH